MTPATFVRPALTDNRTDRVDPAMTAAWRSTVRPVRFAATAPPRLFVIVDTEEEFDWSAPLSRQAVDVSAVSEVGRLQAVLARYGIVPTYVIDFPIATTPASAARFRELAESGDCHIGAHLHPWVNPPYVERLSPLNSYACNLGRDVERAKLRELRDAIIDRLGIQPRLYKAGRYGFGPTTAETLEVLGFDVDASINPGMDFRADGGPDFQDFDAAPFLFGRRRHLLELPCTTSYTGVARQFGRTLHHTASSRWLRPARPLGVLARARVLNRVMLSPEGSTFDEMRALTGCLCEEGIRTFALTLHSPSLKAGCTPYVRTAADLTRFLDTIERYCDYFFGERGGVASTPRDLYAFVCQDSAS